MQAGTSVAPLQRPSKCRLLVACACLIISAALLAAAWRRLRIEAWSRNQEWLLALGLGLPFIVLAAKLLAPPPRASPPQTRWPAFWLCLAFVALSRALPLLAGWFPDGLVWEEHEAAFGARQALDGHAPSLMFAFTTYSLAAGFSVLGLDSTSIRWTSWLLSCGSCALFWGAMRRYVSSEQALCALVSFGVTTPLVASGLLLDEGFTPVIFLQCGLLYGIARILHEGDYTGFAVLGVFTGIAFYEYAPIKLGLIVSIVAAFVQAAATRGQGPLTARAGRGVLSFAIFCLAGGIVALPMIWCLSAGDCREFFDGRKELMIGAKAGDAIAERLPNFVTGLLEHARRTFLEDQGWPTLGPRNRPLISWPLVALPMLGLAVQIVMKVTGRRQAAGPAAAIFSAILAIWAAVALAYCSFWNGMNYDPHRLLCLVPLLVALTWRAIDVGLALIPGAWRKPVLAAATLSWIAHQSLLIYGTFHDPYHRIEFRGKTEGVCQYFAKQGDPVRAAIFWDWAGGGFYYGDSPVEVWARGTSINGYDAWPCRRNYRMTALGPPRRFRSSGGGNFSHLVIGTRYVANDEFLKDLNDTVLTGRLAQYTRWLRKWIRKSDCREVVSSRAYRYLICKLRSGSARSPS